MGLFSGLMALAFVAAAQAPEGVPEGVSEDVDETPAAPLSRRPPAYPASCMPPGDAVAEPQSVTVVFGVTKDGHTENVRARESTDPCFEEAAIAAVRSWTYEPRRVNGKRAAQEDLETTFKFVLEDATQIEDFDARPLLRVPPRYPDRCWRRADRLETVVVGFDVTAEGTTENIRIVSSTNACFDKVAVATVKQWLYRPKIVAGKPVARKGAQTTIEFALGRGGAEDSVRRVVAVRLEKVARKLRREAPPQEILSELAEIEAKYGDSFSKYELSVFHQLRGSARLKAGDYAGALDDLRVAQLNGTSGEASEAIVKTIAWLELKIAEQEREAATAPEGDEEENTDEELQ